jgi:hypothetical protein
MSVEAMVESAFASKNSLDKAQLHELDVSFRLFVAKDETKTVNELKKDQRPGEVLKKLHDTQSIHLLPARE